VSVPFSRKITVYDHDQCGRCTIRVSVRRDEVSLRITGGVWPHLPRDSALRLIEILNEAIDNIDSRISRREWDGEHPAVGLRRGKVGE
jgi:hypothetical protein